MVLAMAPLFKAGVSGRPGRQYRPAKGGAREGGTGR